VTETGTYDTTDLGTDWINLDGTVVGTLEEATITFDGELWTVSTTDEGKVLT